MAELKTKPTGASVEDFLNGLDEKRRADAFTLLEMMKSITGKPPRMWGDSIVAFGDVHLRYDTGRELDWFCVGFSPRKQNLTLYLSYGIEEPSELRDRLGKHKVGKACLYINKLSDVDLAVLHEMIETHYRKFVPA